jgi:hypothetical protein
MDHPGDGFPFPSQSSIGKLPVQLKARILQMHIENLYCQGKDRFDLHQHNFEFLIFGF